MNTNELARPYLTIGEAALELRCSAPTVRRRIHDGSLPAVKLGDATNSGVRIPRAALDAWLWSEPVDEAA